MAGWTTPNSAARWGRWAVSVAFVVPVLYAATRWAWALGIPLGIGEEFLREGQESGLWWAGAALATIAVGGEAGGGGSRQSSGSGASGGRRGGQNEDVDIAESDFEDIPFSAEPRAKTRIVAGTAS